mmetsp:Transcript_19433/g.29400  ORF Transcript_19433/g.29400 Transcript_19433/m.29400 type:complete len:336 (+) Transcript_19433:79-1086(+)
MCLVKKLKNRASQERTPIRPSSSFPQPTTTLPLAVLLRPVAAAHRRPTPAGPSDRRGGRLLGRLARLHLGPLGAHQLGAEVEHEGALHRVRHLGRLVVLKEVPPGAARALHLALLEVVDAHALGAAVPAPVHARLLGPLVPHALGEALPGLLLAHVAARDVLHEQGEALTEPLALLAEEGRLGDAPRVHAAEGDARRVVVAPVQLADRHHVAHFGVLVGLGPKEILAIRHAVLPVGGPLETIGQPLHVAQGSLWVNQPAAYSIGVASNGADNDHALVVRPLLDHILQQQLAEQEVAEMVHSHAHLKPLLGEAGLGVGGKVNGCIAHKSRERLFFF